MEEQRKSRRPIRRRKTKTEIFKEAYLPYIIFLFTLILVIIFIIGSRLREQESTNESQFTHSSQQEDINGIKAW